MPNATAFLSNAAMADQWAEAESPRRPFSQQGWKELPGVGAGRRPWAGGEDPEDTAGALACGGLLADTLVATPTPNMLYCRTICIAGSVIPGKICFP